MKGFALRRSEQGAPLGLLELLTGSQSLASTVERIAVLRRLRITGTIVIILWLLSPLGGQSSLRILDLTHTLTTSPGQIYYFITASAGGGHSAFSEGDNSKAFPLSTILEACLMQSDFVLYSPVNQ